MTGMLEAARRAQEPIKLRSYTLADIRYRIKLSQGQKSFELVSYASDLSESGRYNRLNRVYSHDEYAIIQYLCIITKRNPGLHYYFAPEITKALNGDLLAELTESGINMTFLNEMSTHWNQDHVFLIPTNLQKHSGEKLIELAEELKLL